MDIGDVVKEAGLGERAAEMLAVRAAGLIAADRDAGEESHRSDYVLGYRDRFATALYESELRLDQPPDYLASLARQALVQGELAAEAYVAEMEAIDLAAGAALEAAAQAAEAEQ